MMYNTIESTLTTVCRDRNTEEVQNDDMILFIFHVNAEKTCSDFRKMAALPPCGTVRCRNKTFLIVPVRHLRAHNATAGLV